MASAATNVTQFEANLSCPVCLEMFVNPKTLSCQHSLCDPCLQTLSKFGTIACPTCRCVTLQKDVKGNFHLQAIVDGYKKMENDGQSHPRKRRKILQSSLLQSLLSGKENEMKSRKNCDDIQCELCEEVTKEYCFCATCQKILCRRCQKIHTKIGDCEECDAEEYTAAVASYKAELNSHLSSIDDQLKIVKEKLNNTLEQSKAKLTEALQCNTDAREELHKVVDVYFDVQEDFLNTVHAQCQEEGNGVAQNIEKSLKKVGGTVKRVLSQSSDQELLKKFSELSSVVSTDIDVATSIKLPKFTVTTVDQVGGKYLKHGNILRIMPYLSDENGNRERCLTLNSLCTLRGKCNRILLVKGKLWRISEKMIDIVNPINGRVGKAIPGHFRYCWGADKFRDDVFVAAERNGLYWIKSDTFKVEKLDGGDYWYQDVVALMNFIIVLREDFHGFTFLVKYKRSEDGYTKVDEKTVAVQGHCFNNNRRALCLSLCRGQLYILSSYDKTLYMLDSDYGVNRRYDVPVHGDGSPLTAGKHPDGILIACRNSGRVHKFRPGNWNNWSTLNFETQMPQLKAVSMDQTGNVYCAYGNGPYHLSVFS